MSRSVFFLAASTFALAACQPASEAPATLEAEIPPVIEEPAEADVVGVAADATEDTAATAADDESEDHDGEDHGRDPLGVAADAGIGRDARLQAFGLADIEHRLILTEHERSPSAGGRPNIRRNG